MSNFLKPFAFVKSFFVFGAAFFAMLSISCKQLASFDPVVDGNQTVVGGGGTTSETTEFAFNLKATHGLVRKISLEWTAFSGAKYYEIYFAESSSAEFVKIGETEQPFFDDAVGAGRTGYFKVCAVKANGASSPFSSTVVGTSLAVPIISDGEVGESNANISWSMENARGIDGTDYYEKTLKFEVVCQPKGGSDGETKVLSASSFSGSSYSCEFTNLSSSKDYEFYIKAYLESDTQNYETSPTVDKTTLTAYTPLAPKFLASEGDNAKGISLLITLPEMVTVKAFVKESEIPNEKQDVPFPLCFEIYRKHEKAEAYPEEPVGGLTANGEKCKWYYNGTELTKTSVGYQEDGKPYEAGKQVVWLDDDASLVGGQKYDYMIISVPDVNYSEEVCQDGKLFDNSENKRTPVDKATTAQGWKSAPPSFNVKIGGDGTKLSADKKEVLSVSFGFSAEWNDLGKAGDYKFAIKRNQTPWSGGSGTDSWLKNGETIFFDTLDGINSRVETFGSEIGLSSSEQGAYSYTLYIVSKNDAGTEEIENESNVLDTMIARDKVVVTKEVNLPKAELKAEGGYKNKVLLEIPTCEPNVTYKLERSELVNERPENPETIDLTVPESGVFKYEDTAVNGNRKYSYVLKAAASSGVFTLSKSQAVETLGTPDVSFRKEKEYFGYDSVTISFNGVLAAKEYVVQIGASESGFGGGETFTFAADIADKVAVRNAEVSLNGNTYTVTINNPEGYDNAKLAGTKANVTVKADSGVDNAASAAEVKVLGPAEVGAKVNAAETTDESISVSWNKVDDAKGYLIRRVMYSDAGMKNVAENSAVTYYYEVESGKITTDGDNPDSGVEKNKDKNEYGRVIVATGENGFMLTDTYKEANPDADPAVQNYQEAQSKIAWGLPFRYVVLPVFDKDDFNFNDLELDGNGKVAYKNLAPTKGVATWGYGMNLVAEKAMSGNKQGATWKKPHVDKTGETDYTATKPVVYRRVAGEPGKFEFFRDGSDEIFDENAKMDIKPTDEDSLYGAFEYLVKYYPDDKSEKKISPPESLLDCIATQTTEYNTPSDGKIAEQDNKGYLLAIKNFSAEIDSSKNYYEKISWEKWEHTTRAVGPDKMIIFIQNNNISKDPKEAVVIEEANSNKTIEYVVGSDIDGEKLGASSIRIKPKSVSDSGTGAAAADGLLKVLRDYKHNYTFKLQRNDIEKPVSNKDYDANYIKTAYRQITDEELVKATMLILAAIEQDSGSQKAGSGGKFYLTGSSGTFSGSGSSGNKLTWTITDYVHKWVSIPGKVETPAFIKLSDTEGDRGCKNGAYFLYLACDTGSNRVGVRTDSHFDISKLNPLTVKSAEYGTATVKFAANATNFSVEVWKNNSLTFQKTVTGLEECRKWFPMDWAKKYEVLGASSSYGYFGNDSVYGWWPSSN